MLAKFGDLSIGTKFYINGFPYRRDYGNFAVPLHETMKDVQMSYNDSVEVNFDVEDLYGSVPQEDQMAGHTGF